VSTYAVPNRTRVHIGGARVRTRVPEGVRPGQRNEESHSKLL